VLLRSDGTAVACGSNDYGQCKIPSPKSWRELLSFAPPSCGYICYDHRPRVNDPVRVLQLNFVCEYGVCMLTCSSLAGREVLCLEAGVFDLASDTHKRVAQKLNADPQSIQVVLPDGQLLASICEAKPLTTVSDLVDSLDSCSVAS